MEYRDKTIENEDVLLDGNVYTGCTFRHCKLVVRGERGGLLGACRFEEKFTVRFSGPAGRTLQFISQLYHSSEDGKRYVEDMVFENIRKGIGLGS